MEISPLESGAWLKYAAQANRIFDLADKGRMAVGYDADLTVVDLKARRTITHAAMATRSGWTPFDGMEAKGWPIATIIRGQVVMCDDEIVAMQKRLASLEGIWVEPASAAGLAGLLHEIEAPDPVQFRGLFRSARGGL